MGQDGITANPNLTTNAQKLTKTTVFKPFTQSVTTVAVITPTRELKKENGDEKFQSKRESRCEESVILRRVQLEKHSCKKPIQLEEDGKQEAKNRDEHELQHEREKTVLLWPYSGLQKRVYNGEDVEERLRLILPITIHQTVFPLIQRIYSDTHTSTTKYLSSANTFLPPLLELEERKVDEKDDEEDKVDEISPMNGYQREKEKEKSFYNNDALSKRELSRAAADVDLIYQKAESETKSEESEIIKILYFFLYNLQFTLFISNYWQTMSFLSVIRNKVYYLCKRIFLRNQNFGHKFLAPKMAKRAYL